MPKVVLINVPFASLNLPSIGLSQIKSVLDSEFGDRVDSEIHYLNHDFAHYIGLDAYQNISNSAAQHNAGFGEWLFRQIAFPELADNADEYFGRYYPQRDESTVAFKTHMQQVRAGLDAHLDELITKYKLAEADIVGFTSMFTQHVASLAMARKIKERNPNIVTIIGGANCESPMGQEIVKHVDYIDYVFSGPALKSFPRFIQNYIDGELEKAADIKGVLCKANCSFRPGMALLGKPTGQPSGADAIGEELDLDAGIELDYEQFLDTLGSNFTKKEVEPVLLFETSRGCWWGERAHCTFCGLNGVTMSYRAMNPEMAIKQFESMFKYADRVKRLNCVDNILAKNYFKDVFPMLSPPPGVNIFYEVKADLSEEEMEILATAQVKTIQPGIESLATSTLKLMKKGTSAFQNLFFLKNCISYGIHPEWNLLIGFPGEGEDVYKKYIEDIPSLIHFTPPSGIFPVRFDRYSPYFTQAAHYELDLRPVDYYGLTYPFDKESLSNLAYYFTDHNFSAKYFLTMAKWLGKIRNKFQTWETPWSSKNHGLKPQLHFMGDGGSNVIYDSRSGEALEYALDEATAESLKMMHSKPKRLADLTTHLGHFPGFDAQKTMDFLQEKKLVFHEQGRYMSLVIPHAPASRRSAAITMMREVGSPGLPGVESFMS